MFRIVGAGLNISYLNDEVLAIGTVQRSLRNVGDFKLNCAQK